MLLFLLSFFALSGEPDNFSGRNSPPQNEVVNLFVQKKLIEIAETHNKANRGSDCDQKMLDNLLETTLDRNWPDIYDLTWDANDGPRDIEKSIFAGDVLISSRGFSPSMSLTFDKKNYSVGIDKIDHFFAHGYLNWMILKKNPDASAEVILQALKLGEEQENGSWGLKGLGIKSYADLSANYQGLAFWKDLWHGKPPFFSCEKGRVIVKRQFKIEEYMTAAVDEAINCSSYSSEKMAERVISRTEKLGRKCPIDMSVCKSLAEKIPAAHQPYLLHPLCLGKPSNQVEKASSWTTKDTLDIIGAVAGVQNMTKQFLKLDGIPRTKQGFVQQNEQITTGEIQNYKKDNIKEIEPSGDMIKLPEKAGGVR